MSVYLDTSVVISHFVDDANSRRADALIAGLSDILFISDLCTTEFAAGLSRLVRMSDLAANVAHVTFSKFDIWVANTVQRTNLVSADLASAERMLRRLEFPLHTPDMLHVVMALRLGADLATFDDRMAKVASSLGMNVMTG